MTAAVFALMLVADVDPNALLERVAARYAALTTYSLEVRQNEQRATTHGGGVSGTVHIRLDAAAGQRYYLSEFGDDIANVWSSPPLIISSDGETVWRLDGRWPGPLVEEPGLYSDRRARDTIHELHHRFAMLDGPAMHARYVKTQKIRGRACAVIEIESRLPEAPTMWQEKLWIDPANATILRSHFSSVSNINGRKRVVHRDYHRPPGERPPDERLFGPPSEGRLTDPKPAGPLRR